jgi:hypothetical protein
MPEPAVREAWSGSIPECAATFGVSEDAMHLRVFNLGQLGQPPD